MELYKDVPKGYKRLEYIQSTGTQYIDTGVILDPNSRIIIDCEATKTSDLQCIFCSRTEDSEKDKTSNSFFLNGSSYCRRDYYGDTLGQYKTIYGGFLKRFVVDANVTRVRIKDKLLSYQIPSDPQLSSMNCYLMASAILQNNIATNFSNFAYIKLYSCQIYRNTEVLLRNFIPSQRLSDNAVGLYDTVTELFYTNNGSGTFNFKELPFRPRIYMGIEEKVFNYTEQEVSLSAENFPVFFDRRQNENIWEIKTDEESPNSVFIEPTGSYGNIVLTEENKWLKIIPKKNFKELTINLSGSTLYERNYINFYRGNKLVILGRGGSNMTYTANLTNVIVGEILRFYYGKERPDTTGNEKVQFQLITSETSIIKKKDGTFYTKNFSELINKPYISINNIAKPVYISYIGVDNLSKRCFAKKTLGDLSIGNTLEIPVVLNHQARFGRSIIFKIADKNHFGYPNNCTTLITDKIIQNMAFDAKDYGDYQSGTYGDSDYSTSNIASWANSEANAGEWFSELDIADAAPSSNRVSYNPYDDWVGFIKIFPEKFKRELLLTTTKSYNAEGKVCEGKFFLASAVEVGLDNPFSNEDASVEGEPLALFQNDTSRIAYPTINCINNSGGFSSSSFTVNSGWKWWLRSTVNNSSIIITVGSNGKQITSGDKNYAYIGENGFRPLCNLLNDVPISPKPNANGHYTLL